MITHDSFEKNVRITDANWIWIQQDNYNRYNDAMLARRQFYLESVQTAQLAITADSWYRLYINGVWVADGPCRSWPSHYQYDMLDVASYLHEGQNKIEVIARYFGVGTFHQKPLQAGLLAQLNVEGQDGSSTSIATDACWEVRTFRELVFNTPKISVQMEPYEQYDARHENAGVFTKAAVLYKAQEGPWRDLTPRDCPPLTRTPVAFKRFLGASVVKSDWMCFGFPVCRLLHPGLIEANAKVSTACAIATCIWAEEDRTIAIKPCRGVSVFVNGRAGTDGVYPLHKGENILLALVTHSFSHWTKDVWIRFLDKEGFTLRNPLDASQAGAWCLARLKGSDYVEEDYRFAQLPEEEQKALRDAISAELTSVRDAVKDIDSFRERLGAQVETLPAEGVLSEEAHEQFVEREVIADAAANVKNPVGLLYDNSDYTSIEPSSEGDIELAYDLGEQNCGYYTFDLIADAGVIVDVAGIEYISEDGRLQHTTPYRNSMRYTTKKGVNHFISLKRRSQRFVYITLRNQKAPVRIRQFQLIESTYPVEHVGSFSCSDPSLGRIWDISARTLKLCMEDTFTDCPLYEQTLWVGDARNESLFAYTAFGAEDLAARCIRLTGESLEDYPIVLCQVPSSWGVLLPAWSFLWGISVWDYYYYTGDKEFLRAVWPWVLKNLDGADTFKDERGLFSVSAWNMFDWVKVDDEQRTVLHNSMFLVGAINAAIQCAEVLGEEDSIAPYRARRDELVSAINALWDESKGAFPDAVRDDGSISPSICQHTSFLAVLYDIVEGARREKALQNTLEPPEGMLKVGSPFAMMYLFEALEKSGKPDQIIQMVRDSYQPMLDHDATTVWESFSTGTTGSGGFPTRSHTHAWSAAPIHFLNRIVLGIRQAEPGGAAYVISPRPNGLRWARGVTASVRGPVSVSWRIDGEQLVIDANAPEGVALRFESNDALQGLEVVFNGDKI